jgi:hypothetical protein
MKSKKIVTDRLRRQLKHLDLGLHLQPSARIIYVGGRKARGRQQRSQGLFRLGQDRTC